MELALARLVGAGLTLVFEGFEEAVPPGAVENGLRLIQFIAKHRPDVVASLTEGVVTDIWKEWRQAQLPTEVAIAHIEALPNIMDRCRSSDGMMLGAVAAIQVARRMGSAARPISHSARVATAIMERALETDEFASRGLNDSIAFFFLDRLLARLMPDQQLFLDLRPVFVAYLDSGAWRVPMPASDAASSAAADLPIDQHLEQSSEAGQAANDVESLHEPIADPVTDTSARIAAALHDHSELATETDFTAPHSRPPILPSRRSVAKSVMRRQASRRLCHPTLPAWPSWCRYRHWYLRIWRIVSVRGWAN